MTRLSSTDLSFPASDSIVYPSDFSKEEALGACAAQLQQALADTDIFLSFGTQEPLTAPSAYRIYLTSSDGSEVANLTAAISDVLDDPSTQIVFLTTSRDTRFQAYGVLLPLIEPQ